MRIYMSVGLFQPSKIKSHNLSRGNVPSDQFSVQNSIQRLTAHYNMGVVQSLKQNVFYYALLYWIIITDACKQHYTAVTG